MRGSRNFREGRSGQSDKKKALTTFFFFSPQLILQKPNGQFQRNLSFFKVPEGGPTFSRGRGVQLLPGGIQLLISYRNPYNFRFSRGGGSGTPVPPSGSALVAR